MRTSKLLVTALAALTLMASCTKDEGIDGNSKPVDGTDTYASFRFKVGETVPGVRATMAGENADEDAVVNIRLLIFDTNELSGKLLVNEVVDKDKTATIRTTSGVKRIYVITNTKDKVKIAAKLDGLVVNGSTLRDFYALATDASGALTPDDMGAEFKELLANGSMVMSNLANIDAKKTLQPGITQAQSESATGAGKENFNNFDFEIVRAVAKGNMKIQLKGTEMATTDGLFKLNSSAAFSVRNLNRSVFTVQQYATHDGSTTNNDHGDEGALRPIAPFYNVFDGKDAAYLSVISNYIPYYFKYKVDDTEGKAVTMTANGAGATASGAVYFSPNSNNLSVRGTTTYFGIRTQVARIDKDEIAKALHVSASNKISSEAADADYDNTAGNQSFYYIREIPTEVASKLDGKVRRVFFDKTLAFQAVSIIVDFSAGINLTTPGFTSNDSWDYTDLQTAYEGTAANGKESLNATDIAIVDRYLGHYTNGYSYYRLNIYEPIASNNTKRHFVRRNHAYAATVTSFSTIGDPNEGDLDKDPEKPVDADATYVTATIKLVDWHKINITEDL